MIGWACSYGEMRTCIQNIGCNLLQKCPLRKSKRRLENNIKIDVMKAGCEYWRGMKLAEPRVQ
jgi:hypothetical protein